MTKTAGLADLVPITDRYRWMFACRLVIMLVLVAFLTFGAQDPGSGVLISEAALAWVVLTVALLPLAHASRRAAVIGFTIGLLGDGVVLGAGWWALGGPGNGAEALVAVHVVATTLLASFRTGMKLAAWHGIVALLTLESVAAGWLGVAAPLPALRLAVYVGGLWLITLLTAAFAAVNERELRRRRYDSEMLRTLGLALTHDQSPVDVLRAIAQFGREELLAQRVAVVAYPVQENAGEPAPGFAVTLADQGSTVDGLPGGENIDRLIREAGEEPVPALLRQVDPESDPALAGLMAGARNVIVIPFALEQVVGALALANDRWSRRRTSQRVERRLIATAHQATLNTAVALSRALLMQRMRWYAEYDAVTGLANRSMFDAALARAVHGSRRNDSALSLLLLDLDHFKALNDTYGHLAGDDVLRVVGDALRTVCRASDIAARYGGEEFAVILPGTGQDGAMVAAERIRAAIAGADMPVPIPVTASVGLAAAPPLEADPHELLAAADAALYEAKRRGRNQVAVAKAEPNDVPRPIQAVA